MDKTLGQVFHEAFVARLNDREGFLGGTRVVFGTWDDCEPSYQEDTEAAAEAVVAHTPKHLVAKHFAEASAVIEAAKALHAAMIQSYDGEPVPLAVMVEFKTAVEALQEVEGCKD